MSMQMGGDGVDRSGAGWFWAVLNSHCFNGCGNASIQCLDVQDSIGQAFGHNCTVMRLDRGISILRRRLFSYLCSLK